MARFFLLFVLIVGVLFAAELTPPVQNALVIPWTSALARISAAGIALFDQQVIAQGKLLQSTANGFAVSIEAGCNGVEAALILFAAILAFPAAWPHRAVGILIGLVAIQGLNVLRVISLFYLGQWSVSAFTWAHLYLWPALIMLDVMIVWLLWIRAVRPPVRATARVTNAVAPAAPGFAGGTE
jgi:exosortase H (IPTLxxWG-CTERM-specific)